jgi:hypothetical protein
MGVSYCAEAVLTKAVDGQKSQMAEILFAPTPPLAKDKS